MRNWGFFLPISVLFMLEKCTASVQNIGKLNPGFKGSQMYWIDNDELFLLSNSSNFAFGFTTTKDVTLFLLVVLHKSSSTIVWAANRASPVQNRASPVQNRASPYYICFPGNKCQCPSSLPSCKSVNFPSCDGNKSTDSVELVSGGDGLSYFALGFVQPFSKTTLDGCKESCLGNCSCGAMFFDNGSGNCFLFNKIGIMEGSINGADYTSYIKISLSDANGNGEGGGGSKRFPIVIVIVVATLIRMWVQRSGGPIRMWVQRSPDSD